METDSECIVELDHPFDYAAKGAKVEAQFITLKAPCVSSIAYFARMKQGLIKTMQNASSNEDSDEIKAAVEARSQNSEEESKQEVASLEPGEIIMMLIVSDDLDFADYLAVAKEALLAKGVAFIDGETILTRSLFDKVHVSDFEKMVGSYIRDFIVASALATLQG